MAGNERAVWLAEYRALTEGVGLVDFSSRTLVEVSGEDRAKFLHNLSTNEIRKLAVGMGCEAFLTTVQGKVLAHVFVFSGPNSFVLETVPGQAERIIQHLDRYLIREEVRLHDRSFEWGELLLAGDQSERLLAGLATDELPRQRLASIESHIADLPVWIRRVDITGPNGFLIDCRREDLSVLAGKLVESGAVQAGPEAFEAARLEAGSPLYGRDITDKNLPQEIGRDERTISFTKGCYLGQETVARIDALGHVNKILVGLRFESDSVPSPDTDLIAGEPIVGTVTSSAFSPRLNAPIALAYVRRGSNSPGTRLESAYGYAEVVALPFAAR